MFLYEQSTGVLRRNGVQIGTGYAGHGEGKNNPALESIHDVGPLPRGFYVIWPPSNHPQLGPNAMMLTADSGNTMYGRCAFFMHNDSISHPGDASEGCIVMPNQVLLEVSKGDKILQVVE